MFRRTFSAFTLIAALGAPVLLSSTATAQSLDVRIYDRNHKDYHNWNGDEDRRYRQYLAEHHRSYRALNRQSKKQQADYWKWRHDRP